MRIIKPPALTLNPREPKISWVWYDAADNKYVLGTHYHLWALEPSSTDGVLQPLLIRAEGDELSNEGTGKLTPQENHLTDATLKALIAAGVRGFRFCDLTYYEGKYGGGLDKIYNAFMFLSYPLRVALNDNIEVRHPGFDLTLLFKDRSAQSLGTGSVKKFSSWTHVHLCHPTREAFFTGDNQGKVYLHSCEQGVFRKSQLIANLEYPMNDLAITADGTNLFLAAAGKLQWFRWEGKTYTLVHAIATSPRQIVGILDSGLLVNLGMHGLCFVETAQDSLRIKWTKKLPIAVDVAAVDASFNSLVGIPVGGDGDIVFLSQ